MSSSNKGGLVGPDGNPIRVEKPAGTKRDGPANRLGKESSPYLLQHATNPVDWYPWGDEALDRAREEDKPIFLSIGYAACHWCHVMEHESFENEQIAAFLNEHFVSIKVDREERPDLDDIYMNAVQMIAGQGGWPMSVFLTPALKPFFGGTYFPPEDRGGHPGFSRLLQGLIQAYTNKRQEIEAGAEQVYEGLRAMSITPDSGDEPGSAQVEAAVQQLVESYDATNGGFGGAPKFPHSMGLQLLLRASEQTGSARPRDVALRTLEKMALGGIYDHLAGGFHRYATDEAWLVPHFEKMLYDQALLTVAYLEAYQSTGREDFREVICQTLSYVETEMTSPEGGFYSTEDADTEGAEGRFYVWTRDEVRLHLEDTDADLFCRAYDVDEVGNWEGQTVLRRIESASSLAARFSIEEEDVELRLKSSRDVLKEVRSRRPRPGRDEKILTSWNALMISAFAKSGRALSDARWTQNAEKAAEFILRTLVVEGELFRVAKGDRVHVRAYLEDHANWVVALTDLYETTLNDVWLDHAVHFADQMVQTFSDPAGGFFLTAEYHTDLIVRLKMAQDGSTPSGNSMAAYGLLRLGRLVGREDLEECGKLTLVAFQPYLEKMPAALHQMILAVDLESGPRQEIVLSGDPESSDFAELRSIVDGAYLPRSVFGRGPEQGESKYSGMAGKTAIDGVATAYVCENYACSAPVTTADELRVALSTSGERS